MAPHNYLCVFLATESGDDIGGDPDFSGNSATWGICRPQVRSKWVKPESYLVFIGFNKNRNFYFLKGWFQVAEVITYEEALNRFSEKRNVIIRSAGSPPILKISDVCWKYKKIRDLLYQKNIQVVPDILTSIKLSCNTLFVQNPGDNHEIDNWKCKRIFLCRQSQIQKCIQDGKCPKESKLHDYKGYVIGKNAVDLGPAGIAWDKVAPDGLKGKSLRTPCRQHNVRSISDKDIFQIMQRVDMEIQNRLSVSQANATTIRREITIPDTCRTR